MGQGLLCTGPQLGAGKGSLPKPMAIRGSKWKNQELAELLQSIFSFVFIFNSEIGGYNSSRDQVRQGPEQDRTLDCKTHWWPTFTSRDSSELDSTNHSTMQARPLNSGLGKQAWQGQQALWDALPWHSSPILFYSHEAICAKGPQQQQLKQQSRVVGLCPEWPTALHDGALHIRRKPGL